MLKKFRRNKIQISRLFSDHETFPNRIVCLFVSNIRQLTSSLDPFAKWPLPNRSLKKRLESEENPNRGQITHPGSFSNVRIDIYNSKRYFVRFAKASDVLIDLGRTFELASKVTSNDAKVRLTAILSSFSCKSQI
jgi:hypothetical protein